VSVNKVILVGRLGQDPEVKYTPGGQQVASFSLATDEKWTDKDGTRQERTEWHRIVVWGKTAELCGQYLKKGRETYLEGKLSTRKWTDKDGHERQTTEIVAERVVFIGGGNGQQQQREDAGPGPGPAPAPGGRAGGAPPPRQPSPAQGQGYGAPGGFTDDDIPF